MAEQEEEAYLLNAALQFVFLVAPLDMEPFPPNL